VVNPFRQTQIDRRRDRNHKRTRIVFRRRVRTQQPSSKPRSFGIGCENFPTWDSPGSVDHTTTSRGIGVAAANSGLSGPGFCNREGNGPGARRSARIKKLTQHVRGQVSPRRRGQWPDASGRIIRGHGQIAARRQSSTSPKAGQ